MNFSVEISGWGLKPNSENLCNLLILHLALVTDIQCLSECLHISKEKHGSIKESNYKVRRLGKLYKSFTRVVFMDPNSKCHMHPGKS